MCRLYFKGTDNWIELTSGITAIDVNSFVIKCIIKITFSQMCSIGNVSWTQSLVPSSESSCSPYELTQNILQTKAICTTLSFCFLGHFFTNKNFWYVGFSASDKRSHCQLSCSITPPWNALRFTMTMSLFSGWLISTTQRSLIGGNLRAK